MIELNTPQQNRFGDSYFPEINQQLFAKESAESVFKRNFPHLFEPSEMLYIVVGTDSGLFYEFVQRQTLPKHMQFVFIEYDQLAEQMPTPFSELNDLDPQVAMVAQNFRLEKLLAKFNTYFIRRRVQLIKSMAVTDSPKNGLYELLWKQIKPAFDTLGSNVLQAQNAYQFENARLLNAADNLIPIKQLNRPLEGLCAVLIGGGPTLDDSLAWIRDNQHKLVIFSVARVAARLLQESIVPDFFVSVDPHDVSFDNSKGIFEFADRSILLNSYHINPKILGQWPGLKAYGGAKYGWKDVDVPSNVGSPGPTVVNSAFHYATEMGCKKLFLSGVDFCFAKGQTHESSSNEAKLSAQLQFKNLLRVETNRGAMAETKLTLFNTQQAFQQQVYFQLSRNAALEVFSLGADSAKMDKVAFASAPDATTFTDKVHSIANLKQQLQLSPAAQLMASQTVTQELAKELKRFKSVQRFAQDALAALPKLLDKQTQQPKQKVKNKIERLRKKINNTLADDADLLMNYNFMHFSENFNPEQVLDETQGALTQLTVFFTSVDAALTQYLQLLALAEERAQLRVKELRGVTPLEIAPYWDKYQEPGRAFLWTNLHAASTEQENQLLDDFYAKFAAELSLANTKLYATLKQKTQSLSVLADKAKEALLNRNSGAIAQLKGVAEQLEIAVERDALLQLLVAMEADLAEQTEQALQGYLAINEPVVRHVALQQAANLAFRLERYQDALMILEALCRFSLDYMLPYAEVFDILGNTEMAVQVVELYLQQKPQAYLANLKLAEMYQKLGDSAAAKQVLERVLLVDPDNSTAKFLLAIENAQ
ncbi:hypothetical protein THMIRHAS_08990 [Thiosulfatimonas sediminis]|uniref:6-hydroxymethylpterin diphosphokinase MptE-like domain-containing protein n=1 Tax=Thiosulfatimonas sediminis TaxID=2675054 RepID=A0A6F8PTU9_9GAMM|nr:6-hydroxymethylpterin diphosphokinase MptE-like protein [Thiosulfatimonas sediminis]BBP45526.1 hypothetical protein THMIRHAS_08990 [Thiosulfatimonas sediminis]